MLTPSDAELLNCTATILACSREGGAGLLSDWMRALGFVTRENMLQFQLNFESCSRNKL